jgi:hypothetical protein
MKILIQNYSSPVTTEPMYLDGCFNKTSSIQSKLWSNEVSAFDVMDMFSPDYVLCHYRFMSNDLVKYMSGNKKHSLILNITGCDQETLSTIESTLSAQKIECELLLNNFPEQISPLKPKAIKIANILPAADLFLKGNDNLDFNLDAGIVSTSKDDLIEEIASSYKTYHKIKFAGTLTENYDISASILNLTNLYGKYKNFIIADDAHFIFSQLFFDSMLMANRVIVRAPEQQKELVDRILASLFHYQEGDDISTVIKNQVLRKHTCYNRSARLARLLKDEKASIELTKIAETL